MTTARKSHANQRDNGPPAKARTNQVSPPKAKKPDKLFQNKSPIRKIKQKFKAQKPVIMDVEEVEVKAELLASKSNSPKSNPKDIIVIDPKNIIQYLTSTTEEEIHALSEDHLRLLVSVWYKKHKKNTTIMKSWTRQHLLIEIDDIIEDAQSTVREEKIRKRIEDLHHTVDDMLGMSFTNSDELKEYSHEHLIYYFRQYTKDNKNEDIPIKSIKAWSREELIQKIQNSWPKKINDMVSPKINAPPLVSPSKPKQAIVDHDEPMPLQSEASNEHHNEKILSPLIQSDIKKTPISQHPEEQPTTSPSPKDLMTMDLKELTSAYCSLRNKAGFPQNEDTIQNTWSEEMLRRAIKKMLPSSTKVSASNLKPSKYAKNANFKQSNLQGLVLNTCRYTLNFELPKQKKGVSGLRSYLSDIFHEMGVYCEGITILPWDSDSLDNPVDDCDNIPDQIKELQKYFKDAKSYENGGYVFSKIRLGFPISNPDKSNFEHNIRGWLQNRSIRMYECAVQHMKVCTCAWLLYAPGTLDQKSWSRAVMESYRKTHLKKGLEIKIGLVWRALNGQKNLERKEKVYAMHVETPVHLRKITKKYLRTLAAHKRWPQGVRFRVVDEYFLQMKDANKQKYRYCKDRHSSFLKNLGKADCTQIISLDKKIKIGDSKFTTLRYILLGIKDNEDNRRIFATVDEKYNSDDKYVVTFRPDKSAKAMGFIDSLSTYVQHVFPNVSFEKILTIEAIDQARYERYDPQTQLFTTEEDIDLDVEIQADIDDDSFEYLNDSGKICNPFEFDDSIKLIGNPKMWNLTGEEDTVSAMTASSVSFTNDSTCMYYDVNSPADRSSTTSTVTNTVSTLSKDTIQEDEPVSLTPNTPSKFSRMVDQNYEQRVARQSISDLESQIQAIQKQLALARATSTTSTSDVAEGK